MPAISHRLIILCCAAMLAASGAHAQYTIGIYADQAGSNNMLPSSAPGLTTVYVVAHSTEGMTGAQFTAALPPCWLNATYLSDSDPFPIPVGNSQTGKMVGFGACLTGSALVTSINLFAPDGYTDGCCEWPVTAYPSSLSSNPEVADCASNIVDALGVAGFVGGYFAPDIFFTDPPDASTQRPVDQKVAWDFSTCSAGIGVVWADVFFGTDPNPPIVVVNGPAHPGLYDPGILQAETTYYWMVRIVDTDAGTSETAVQRFTTGTPRPTRDATWGAIKAVYGD